MPSSGAFVCSDFVVLGVLRRKIVVSNEALQATGINTFSVIRPPPRIATSNTGFEARHGVGASISHLRSLLWRNICLFRRCPGSPQSLPNLLLSIGLSCRNRSGDR